MKNTFLFSTAICMFICIQLSAQQITYSDLNDAKSEKSKGAFAKYTSYISQSGAVYKVDDTLQIGKPSGSNGKFVYVINQEDIKPVGPEATNTNIIIKLIKVHSVSGFSKTGGYKIKMFTGGGFFATKYEFLLEDAIQAGEIKSLGKTSDEALAELKKAKEKLDLELITQEEFDKLKEELKQYIK